MWFFFLLANKISHLSLTITKNIIKKPEHCDTCLVQLGIIVFFFPFIHRIVLIMFQVTFVSSEPMPPQFARPVKVGNVTYNLYSHSFLHYGQVQFVHIY